jgi:hypothetical protein
MESIENETQTMNTLPWRAMAHLIYGAYLTGFTQAWLLHARPRTQSSVSLQ